MEHEAAAEVHHGVQGMPQLFFGTWPNLIFWLLVAMVVTWWVLSKIALPRIGAVLAERSGTITNDIAAAEELSLKVKEAEKAYDKALADARAEAGKIAAQTRAEIQAEIDAAIAKADEQISAKTAESEKVLSEIRASATDNVRLVASETAQALIEALGGSASEADVQAAVAARVGG